MPELVTVARYLFQNALKGTSSESLSLVSTYSCLVRLLHLSSTQHLPKLHASPSLKAQPVITLWAPSWLAIALEGLLSVMSLCEEGPVC